MKPWTKEERESKIMGRMLLRVFSGSVLILSEAELRKWLRKWMLNYPRTKNCQYYKSILMGSDEIQNVNLCNFQKSEQTSYPFSV